MTQGLEYRVAVLLDGQGPPDDLVSGGGLEFFDAGPPGEALPLLLDGGTMFLSDDGAALARAAAGDVAALAGVVLADPGLDPADFGFDPLLVTFMPPQTPAAAVRAVLLSIGRRLDRYMELGERLARNESRVRSMREEQKRFLVEMLKRNERLRHLEENSTDWIWEIDADRRFTYSSPRCADILGLGPEELLGRGFAEFLGPGDGGDGARESAVAGIFGRQERFSARHFIFHRPDGGQVHLETSAVPLFSAEGRLRGHLGVARDVSEKRMAAARITRLLSVQRMVNSVLEAVITDIPFRDQLEHLLDVALSLAFPRMLPKGAIFTVENGDNHLTLQVQRGFSEEQLRVCSRVPFGTCVCGRVAAEGRLLAASCDDEVHEFRFAGAEPHSHYCVPVSSRGRILGVLNVYMAAGSRRDPDEEDFLAALANALALMIERHRAEEEKTRLLAAMARDRRLDSVSRLAAGLAHDFNNILTGISGYAMLTMLDMDGDDKRRKNLEAIGASCRRAADLVRRLSAFASQGELEVGELHLGGLMTGRQKELEQLMGPGVKLEITCEGGLWPVMADEDLIENILFSLARNSREAMGGAGVFRLACGNVTVDRREAARMPGMRPGDYVMLEAADDGRGMEPEVAELVFDPFFTTSGDPGRGLGLATVYGAMKRLGGNVYVESRPGEGTVFRLYFPRAGGQVGRADHDRDDGWAEGIRVLLVEDDDQERDCFARILEQAGMRVTPCGSGAEALAAGADFDIVVADIVLPESNGVEVARDVLARNPAVRTLFISGFFDAVDQYADELVTGRNFIAKPVMPAVLLRAVRRVLEV